MRNFISNIVAGIIAAALFAFLQTNSTAVLASINAVPNPMLICSVAALVLLGLCIGWLLRGFFVWRPKRQVDRGDENENTNNREVIMQMEERNKRLLKALVVKGELFCTAEDWESYCLAYSKEYLQQFMDYETIQGSRIRLRPKSGFKQFYESNSDLFEVIDDRSIDERVVYDPEKRLPMGHYYMHELSWWWYTDNREIQETQDRIFEEQVKRSNSLLMSDWE